VLLIIVLQSANSIFPSIAADLHDSGEHERLNRVYTAVTKWVTYLTVLGLAFVLIYNTEILSIFGTTVQSAQTVLMLLAVGQTINAAVGPTGFLLIMTGHERLQVVNNVIVAILNLILNLVLIQQYGIIGAAGATTFSLVILNLLRLAEVWYLLKLQPYSRNYLKGAIAIGGAVLVLLLGRTVPVADLLRMVGAGFIALCAFTVLVWVIGLDETDEVLIEAVERT